MKTKNVNRLYFLTSLLFVTFFYFQSSFAGPFGYKEGRWILKAKESYFSTRTNFDKNGIQKELTNKQSLTLLTTALSVTYDVSQSISLFTTFESVFGESVGYDFTRSRFAPTDIRIGGDFLLLSTFVDIVPEVVVSVPLTSIETTTDEVILSEGVLEIRGGVYLSKRFDWLSTYGYLGYAARPDGRSSVMPYEFQILKSISSIQLTAGIWGYESVTDDIKTSSPGERNIVTSRVNGSSLKFYAVNPALTEVGGSLGFELFADIFSRFGYSHTIMGANTAYGDTFWATLSYSFGGSSRADSIEAKKNALTSEEKKAREFTPETYETDKAFDEAVEILRNEEVKPAPTPTPEPKSKTPVSVKLRSAKPPKKPKK